jgi:hypothetical protein
MPQEVFDDLRKTIAAGRPWHGVVKNKRKDGGFYWVDATITPVIENGMIMGYQSTRFPASEAQKSKHEKMYKDIREGNRRPPNSLEDLTPRSKSRLELYTSLGLITLFEGISLTLGLLGYLDVYMMIFTVLLTMVFINKIRSLILIDDDTRELKAVRELARGNFRIRVPKHTVFTEPLELLRAMIASSNSSDIDCKTNEAELTALMDTIDGMAIFVDMEFKVVKYSLSALRLEKVFNLPLSQISLVDYIEQPIYVGLTRKHDKQLTSILVNDCLLEARITPIVVRGDTKGYLFLFYYSKANTDEFR